MTTTHRSRRRALRHAAQGPRRTSRKRASELEPGDPTPITSWGDRVITAQLAEPFVSDGRLPPMAVGELHELAPVLRMSCYSPTDGEDAAWWCGPLGTQASLATPCHSSTSQSIRNVATSGRWSDAVTSGVSGPPTIASPRTKT